MPDTREKLIELLDQAYTKCLIGRCNCCSYFDKYNEENCEDYLAADYLIAHGVRLEEKQATSNTSEQFASDNNVGGKWIPVTEKLPTIHDADADNCVLAIHKVAKKRYHHWRTVVDNPYDFTHWMRTPEPPEEVI